MLRDCDWSIDRDYKTKTENEPIQFYLDALTNSTEFYLLLGYFSSAAINLLSVGFATFIANGGNVKLVINHLLSEKDKNVFETGQNENISKKVFDLTDVIGLQKVLDEYDIHFFECLAYLISEKRITLKIIKPKEGNGIAHYKSGVFHDGVDFVGYKASCNFTLYGLSENLEELEAFLSWENGRSNKLIKKEIRNIENYFTENDKTVDYLLIDEIQIAIKDKFGNKDISELIVQEEQLLKKKISLNANPKLKLLTTTIIQNIDEIKNKPRFPYPTGPRQYQSQAYLNWINNNRKGLFAMATGTGKTITSLNCILEDFKLNDYYRFIVLVPTISLAKQWEIEITENFNFNELVVCSSQNTSWEDEVRSYGRNVRMGVDVNFCILLTYATFRGIRFQSVLNDLFKPGFYKMTIIADEAHTFGSNKLLSLLPHGILNRIGLSATPERQFDEVGEQQICEYFDSSPPEYTFNYNMKKAIQDKVLCKYYYYPIFVELETEELLAYQTITNKLNKFLDTNTGRYKDDPYVNMLLIQRKNIIHKANQKANCLINIINKIGKEKFKYAFIYVPEGYETDYEQNDNDIFNIEDDNIIDSYTKLIYERYQLKLKKFTGETSNRNEILKQFSEGKLDALLAMKCLDEGIDIPQTKYAIFCSSTGNPRQYIQRRGRVLRFHEEKEFAHIYDMIVKPTLEVTSTDIIQRRLEKNIFKAELTRLINFAVLSENKMEVLKNLEELCNNLELDIYDLANIEEEKYN
jgi:superfamily II DNA or RNA helicase